MRWWDTQSERYCLKLHALLSTPEGRRQFCTFAAIVIVSHLVAWAWRIFA